MTCAEFKELCAAYALGAVDEAERAACNEHLAQPTHEGCLEALAEAELTLNAIPLALTPVRPRAEMWDAIERAVAPATVPKRRPAWHVALPTVLFVAAAAVAIFLYRDRSTQLDRAVVAEKALSDGQGRFTTALAGAEGLRRDCETQLGALKGQLEARQEAVALLSAPGAKLVKLAPDPKAPATDHRAVVILDTQQGKAAIVAQGLAAQPGKDYELWVIKGDAKKAAGLLRGDASGGVAIIIDPSVLAAGVDAFAVTLEATGGGDAPKGPILLVGLVGKV
jgi:anti-sigma-K factor RskA